ncbi:MFS transporter [Entomomonas sp. E2T0]|uniref:AmpG family muropeptide MFS transporter n=1 Tax=Entomomonas sp. E2T0 TaxID=2930213 RepID=UPI002228122D|nr:MFS transporter [Entomomonas sp. E2T0]UYZ83847.1 MFS transporter [Entomomonas sp. E2T0]
MRTNTVKHSVSALKLHPHLVILVLGFSAGIPSLLISSTLGIWLLGAGASFETIGYLGWIGLIYALKWVWAPMLDQWRLPWLGRLGRRRSWLLFAQICIFTGLVCVALTDPQDYLRLFIIFACLVAFFSATQDIALDAYRLEIADQSQQAKLAALYIIGFRTALLIAGAGSLLLATYLGTSEQRYYYTAWQITYMVFAVLMIPAMLVTLFSAEPNIHIKQEEIAEAEFSFGRQLFAVVLVLFLVVSLPVMITAIMDKAWPRALLYALILITGLSPWGKSQILPVRILLRRMRHHLKLTARAKEIPNFDFVHQSISIIVMLIVLVTIYASSKAYIQGAWPRGTLYLLIFFGCITAPGRFLMAPILTPMVEFIQRYRWQALLILAIVSTYKLADTMPLNMIDVFLLKHGFSQNIIAIVVKGFGIVLTIIGAGFSVFLINKFRIMPVLFFGGVACAFTNLLYILLINDQGSIAVLTAGDYGYFLVHNSVAFYGAIQPLPSIWEQVINFDPHIWTLISIVIFDSLSAGIAVSALLAYLAGLTNIKFSATQYAMLSSVMLLLPKFMGGYSGRILTYYDYDYQKFFWICVLSGLPTLLFIGWAWLKQGKQGINN